jgi:hypothetical protein
MDKIDGTLKTGNGFATIAIAVGNRGLAGDLKRG